MSVRIETSPRTKLDRSARDSMLKVFQRVRPGTKIRCVTPYEHPVLNCPQLGGVYTVREMRRGLWTSWALGFTLAEIVNEVDPEKGSEPFWAANAFTLLEDEAGWHEFVNELFGGQDWPN